ncbi:MAG: RNA polymerase sigma factor [Lachnospiraceae bacterium]|nr:RNA polymerase sigma factor [Lachnospiraceae bacterium]
MLFKICLVILGNEQDVQDAIQETFLRYLKSMPEFQSEEHEKAWLIRVAVNVSKDMRRFQLRHPKVSIEQLEDYYESPQDGEILEELLELPYKLKVVIYLHYIEGYRIKEVASILNISQDAVKKRLQRGREELRLLCSGKGMSYGRTKAERSYGSCTH